MGQAYMPKRKALSHKHSVQAGPAAQAVRDAERLQVQEATKARKQQALADKAAAEAALRLQQEEEAEAARAAEHAQQQAAKKAAKRARQKQRKQVRGWVILRKTPH